MSAAAGPGARARLVSARELGLVACQVCALVSRALPGDAAARCPRCGARLLRRRPASLARTWAFLIGAAILYLPANLLPIMESSSLFGAQRDTILSGVAFLWDTGSWILALLVFFASIVVPLLKMFALALLAASAQLGYARRRHQRARLYRMVEFIGRWSMLDIYVVTILVALVQLGVFATVTAEAGAAAFGAVVVLTMFAAMSFDPRLIWDSAKERHG